MKPFTLKIVTPLASEEYHDVTAIDIPADAGRLTVMPGHIPLICRIRPGPVNIRHDQTSPQTFNSSGGTLMFADGTGTMTLSAMDKAPRDR